MSLPGSYVSGIRTHYNRKWKDNYTLKLYRFYKVICSEGVSVRTLTVALNIEEMVSFLSAKLCLCVSVCVCVPVCTCPAWIQMVHYWYRKHWMTELAVPAAQQPPEEHLLPHRLTWGGWMWTKDLFQAVSKVFSVLIVKQAVSALQGQELIDHFFQTFSA